MIQCLAFKYPWLQLPSILRLSLLLLLVTGLLLSHLLLKQGFTPVGTQFSRQPRWGGVFRSALEDLLWREQD